ncbi:MAG: SRPBCC family protein [Planctomycetaceae bacterium]
MPKYTVQRSIVIRAPIETVFDTVVDYSTWTRWSPWLGIDRNAVVKVSDDPKSVHSVYHWNGDLVGHGEIEHFNLERPTLIEDQIRFFKPFRSRSGVSFILRSVDDGTQITWQMDGRLPWLLFWMQSNMEAYIGMDYERGLKMLAELIETGQVLSQTHVIGVEQTAAQDVYGVAGSCPTDDVGPAMSEAFAKVNSAFSSAGLSVDGRMLSIYHPCDLKKRQFHFTSGYSVNPDSPLPDGLVHCRLPPGRTLHIRHTGRYENLGNAWSGAHQYARYKKLKLAHRDAWEVYANSPDDTPLADLVTNIFLPLK